MVIFFETTINKRKISTSKKWVKIINSQRLYNVEIQSIYVATKGSQAKGEK